MRGRRVIAVGDENFMRQSTPGWMCRTAAVRCAPSWMLMRRKVIGRRRAKRCRNGGKREFVAGLPARSQFSIVVTLGSQDVDRRVQVLFQHTADSVSSSATAAGSICVRMRCETVCEPKAIVRRRPRHRPER